MLLVPASQQRAALPAAPAAPCSAVSHVHAAAGAAGREAAARALNRHLGRVHSLPALEIWQRVEKQPAKSLFVPGLESLENIISICVISPFPLSP
jgi:hypothetical protein